MQDMYICVIWFQEYTHYQRGCKKFGNHTLVNEQMTGDFNNLKLINFINYLTQVTY